MRDGALAVRLVRPGQSEHVIDMLEMWCVQVNDLEGEIRELVDDVREGRTVKGTVAVSGFVGPPSEEVILVGLARFQSYRGRTEAALVQEIVDLVEESNAQYLSYEVLTESGTVRLEV